MSQASKQLKCRPRGKPWPPGVSGNLAGRAKGSLNKLSLAVRGELLVAKPQDGREKAPTPEPVKFDPRRPHAHTMTKIEGIWQRAVGQDGRIFDRDTGVLLA